VNLAKGRQTASHVDYLAHRRPGAADEVPDSAAEELPVAAAGYPGIRDQL
jgi:hypothetical protein